MSRISKKYSLCDVCLFNVTHGDISRAVKEYSRERICHGTMITKSIPMVAITRKVTHEHYVFNMMQARALTCFNTGNLVFKDLNPHQFRNRDKGDQWCLERAFEGKDFYEHVRYECKSYKTRYVEFLLRLNQERIARLKTPLIIPAPPL